MSVGGVPHKVCDGYVPGHTGIVDGKSVDTGKGKTTVYDSKQDAITAAQDGVGGNADTDYVVEPISVKNQDGKVEQKWAVRYATGADGQDLKTGDGYPTKVVHDGDKALVIRSKVTPFKADGGFSFPAADPAKAAKQKKFADDMNKAGMGKDVDKAGGFLKKGSASEKTILMATGFKSVEALQKHLGVKADGKLGPDTMKAIAQQMGGTSFFHKDATGKATDDLDAPKFIEACAKKVMEDGFADAGFKPVQSK